MGWTTVLGSVDVGPGSTVSVVVGEVDIVVWRTAAGVLSACDSRCPHQWSHLAAVGTVDGEELVCLSHFWRFDTAGRGTKEAMNGRRDPKSDVVTFAVRERDGGIEVLFPDGPG